MRMVINWPARRLLPGPMGGGEPRPNPTGGGEAPGSPMGRMGSAPGA